MNHLVSSLYLCSQYIYEHFILYLFTGQHVSHDYSTLRSYGGTVVPENKNVYKQVHKK